MIARSDHSEDRAAALPRETAASDGGMSPETLLSRCIQRLAERAKTGSLTIYQALAEIAPAPPLLFCSLMALPFCQPVPTVGLSAPFGLGVASIAGALLLGRNPSVPSWLGRRQVPTQLFPMLLSATAKFVGLAERVLKPRARWMFLLPLGRIWAAVVVINAVCLALPLPIPFSNSFPAVSIVAICLGSSKQDGVVVGTGLAIFAVALGFLAFLGLAGMALWGS